MVSFDLIPFTLLKPKNSQCSWLHTPCIEFFRRVVKDTHKYTVLEL